MMRTFFIKVALCAAIILAPNGADARSKDFKALSKIAGVEHVHIPKLLINLAAKNGEGLDVGKNVTLGDYWSGDLLKKIDTVDVFSTGEKGASEKMGQQVRSIVGGNDWEALVDVKDEDGQKVKICQLHQGRHTTFVIFAEEEDEASLVVIKGEVDMAKLLEQQTVIEGNTSEK